MILCFFKNCSGQPKQDTFIKHIFKLDRCHSTDRGMKPSSIVIPNRLSNIFHCSLLIQIINTCRPFSLQTAEETPWGCYTTVTLSAHGANETVSFQHSLMFFACILVASIKWYKNQVIVCNSPPS